MLTLVLLRDYAIILMVLSPPPLPRRTLKYATVFSVTAMAVGVSTNVAQIRNVTVLRSLTDGNEELARRDRVVTRHYGQGDFPQPTGQSGQNHCRGRCTTQYRRATIDRNETGKRST